MRSATRQHPIASSDRCLAIFPSGQAAYGTQGVSYCFRKRGHEGQHEAALRDGLFLVWPFHPEQKKAS